MSTTDATRRRTSVSDAPGGARRARLWLEFLVLFVGVPAAMATVVPVRYAFPLLAAMTVVGVALLALTPGFRWRALIEGPLGPHWRATLIFTLGTAIVATALTLWLRPAWFLFLPREVPGLWAMILLLYPVLSVIPQELLYRPLFFERYGALLGGPSVAIAVNALCFGLAHAFYANWVAVTLTTVGGAAFAWAYVHARSFPLAVLWHTLAGQLIFTSGLGRFFYHGAIPN